MEHGQIYEEVFLITMTKIYDKKKLMMDRAVPTGVLVF